MCLRVDKSKKGSNGLVFDKAEEDITCYKVLVVEKSPFLTRKNEKYFTPYMEMNVKLRRRYNDDRPVATHVIGGVVDDEWVKVEGGVFHLFKNLDDAISEAAEWPDSIVVEAVIPKRAEHLEGVFKCGYSSYVSYGTKSVIYKKKVWPLN